MKITGLVLCGVLFFLFVQLLLLPNTKFKSDKYHFYVSGDQDIYTIIDSLSGKNIITQSWSLQMLAYLIQAQNPEKKLLEIKKDWNNFQILYHLKNQEIRPFVQVSIPVRQLRYNVVKSFCKELSISEMDFFGLVEQDSILLAYPDFDKESVYSLFIANNFWVYKDVNPGELLERLYEEYLAYWNDEKLARCEEIGLSPVEVGILASIVYAETKVEDEMPHVAGLYLNRLNNDMRLQADPTVVYAAGQKRLKRVLKKHKSIKSAYNTYRKKGLPPGPVFTVPPIAIDAVLNYSEHDYLFFCAKDDLSGGHVFAETYEEHLENARKYQNKLNKLGIYR
ncbi:MAG: endolytic transglycosylase MltG [Cytophagaceae bacterium]